MKSIENISMSKLAALERAKALGLEINRPEISSFERKAREWRRCKEAEKAESQRRKSRAPRPRTKTKDLELEVPNENHNPVSKNQGTVRSKNSGSSIAGIQDSEPGTNMGFDWQPYRPQQGEGDEKEKRLNAASVSRIALKIMAREWNAALGISRGIGCEQVNFERKLEKQRRKKVAERERKELEEERAFKQKAALEEALQAFGRNLLDGHKPFTREVIEALLEKAFRGIGEIIYITWQSNECRILLEPWVEKRLRWVKRETLPNAFQVIIDDNFSITSYERIEHPNVLKQAQKDIILKGILSNFRKSSHQDFSAFENAVANGGRIIRSMTMNSGFKINFEPWVEMRKRNIKRKGRPPIVTYTINADKDFNHISCQRV